MGAIKRLFEKRRDKRWQEAHALQVREILNAFVELAFEVEDDPSLLDDEEDAAEFFAIADVCHKLLEGKRLELEPDGSFTMRTSFRKDQAAQVSSDVTLTQPRRPGELLLIPERRGRSFGEPHRAAIAEYRACKELGDAEGVKRALNRIRLTASQEYAARYGLGQTG